MILVLLGAPGCGKGTQAEKISAHYSIPSVSTGDLFRTAVRNETPLGLKVKKYMDNGHLVPNEITVEVMKERVSKSDCANGYILDGFPRSVEQAESLGRVLVELNNSKIDHVLSFDVPEEELVKRLTGRRMCRKCGAGYHVMFKKPANDGACDACRGELYQRNDDKEEVIRSRLKVYDEQTAPLLDYYKNKGLLREVEGVGDINSIFDQVRSLIEE
ncbi:adenylate kinase [bacterium]|nr:adenylate kinase [bacterium]